MYSPRGVSLIDAIVQVGGCTGSFISKDGLVITNHHCAFGAVQAISSKEKDYITDGFLAPTRAEEVSARGMTIRITESYKDVSSEVLSVVSPGMALAERTRAIEKKMREIEAAAEKKNAGKRQNSFGTFGINIRRRKPTDRAARNSLTCRDARPEAKFSMSL